MRRSSMVKLLGLSEETFNLIRARKLLPMRSRDAGSGWQEFSAEDALAIELSVSMARQGLKRADARDLVNEYFDDALDRLSERDDKHLFLGAVKSYGVLDGQIALDDQFPLIGSAQDIADELAELGDKLGPNRFLDGAILVNVHLCIAVITERAARAGLEDFEFAHLKPEGGQ